MFQTSILRKYLNLLDEETTQKAYACFKEIFLNSEKQGNIRSLSESQYQEGFCRELFCQCLGYTIAPDPGYNLKTEQRNQTASSDKYDNRKADAAIILNENVVAVIELKGCDTIDLGKVENQAFGYRAHNPGCRIVIISNFERLRFYIDDASDYLEFNLFNLPYEEFRKLYLILALEQIKKDIPAKLKSESLTKEKDITAQFYKDYSGFKRKLFDNICRNNLTPNPLSPDGDRGERGEVKLLLFRKTQKLLDRFLFIFFCEDRGLIPANTIAHVIKRWKTLKDYDAYQPLYNRFKLEFAYINEGHDDPDKSLSVFAYNGGLFKPDEVLDNLIIDDDILLETQKLSDYDFESDVSVDILGHIFEHSLTEIEEIQRGLTSDLSSLPQLAEASFPPLPMGEGKGGMSRSDRGLGVRSKRKKDGVFYTPAYITKYIVENTVGRLCEEKKKELHIDNETYAERNYRKTKKEKETIQQLDAALETYQKYLLSLKICDPACGSGAFLNAALAFLKEEHRLIDRYRAHIYGYSLIFQYVDDQILENNLYGVDINEESVEIAKLSLWLHTARPGRKLTSLNNNIKCGNSLIDDPAVAGDKAFCWEKEFPEIFANGGFDVVIGNPPYVNIHGLDYTVTDHLKKMYKTAYKRLDLSICFIERSKYIIKNEGLTCFITSNQFLSTEYGLKMRKFLLGEYYLVDCIDFGDLRIFQDALTYVSIFTLNKQKNDHFKYCRVNSLQEAQQISVNQYSIIPLSSLTEDNWVLESNSLKPIFEKIQINSLSLESIGNAWAGLFTGLDNVMMFDKNEIENYGFEKEVILPVLRANNCNRYYCSKAEKFVIYPYKECDSRPQIMTESELSKYTNVYNHLCIHKKELEMRKDSRKSFEGRTDWFCLTRFGQKTIFEEEKIVSPGEVKEHKFSIDYSGSGYSCARVFAITIKEKRLNLKYILTILNSTLIKTYLQSIASLKQGGYYSYSSNILNRTPIKDATPDQQAPLIALADAQLAANEQLQKYTQKFLNRVQSTLGVAKVTEKLSEFYKYDFSVFQGELKKQKVKLSLRDQDEWEEYFNSYRQNCTRLLLEIEENDRKIDRLVYDLYGLTEEEIAIVEGRTN